MKNDAAAALLKLCATQKSDEILQKSVTIANQKAPPVQNITVSTGNIISVDHRKTSGTAVYCLPVNTVVLDNHISVSENVKIVPQSTAVHETVDKFDCTDVEYTVQSKKRNRKFPTQCHDFCRSRCR